MASNAMNRAVDGSLSESASKPSILRQFWTTLLFFEVPRARIVLLLVIGVSSSCLAVAVPMYFGSVIDWIATNLALGGSFGSLNEFIRSSSLLGFVLLAVTSDLTRILYGYLAVSLTNILVIRARSRIADASVPENDARTRHKSDIGFMLSSDCHQLRDLYSNPLTTVMADLLDTVLIALVIGTISIKLMILVTLPLVPIFFIARKSGALQRRIAIDTRRTETEIVTHADTIVANWMVVRVFNGLAREKRRTEAILGSMAQHMDESNSALAKLMLSVGGLKTLATVTSISVAAVMASTGEIPIGAVATLMLYLSRFYSPAINLSKAYQAVQRAAISAERVVGFIVDAEAPVMRRNAPLHVIHHDSVPDQQNELAWRDVALPLPDGRITEVQNTQIAGPGLILITGPSGIGKSTLLKQILGLGSLPANGTFSWNGTDLQALDQPNRLALFSYAGQDNILPPGAVLECVNYPSESTDKRERAQAIQALGQVGLAGFGSRLLPNGDADVSGGEARRIVLARALRHPAPVLVADEVTSNLDADAKAAIERALLAESRRRIVILTAHNPGAGLLDNASAVIELSSR